MTVYEKWRDMPVLVPGDLVFFRDARSKVSFLIRLMSTMRGEGPTFANHVGVMYNPTTVCEAIAKGVCFTKLLKHYAKAHVDIAVYRHARMGPNRRLTVQRTLRRYEKEGRGYGWWKVAAHFLDYGLSAFTGYRKHVYGFRRLCRMKNYPQCAWLASWVMRHAHLPFLTPMAAAQPDDLMDECNEDYEWTRIWRTDG
jgi:hypothetical protein